MDQVDDPSGTAPSAGPPVRVLVVDNYDSFVFTLVGYLRQLGAEVDVVRNDEVTPEHADDYDGVLLSPGPGTPGEAGICVATVRRAAERGQPLLGVCLGHQALAEAFGATVTHAPELLHGKTSPVLHGGDGVLAGLSSPFTATRYHSLAVVDETIPGELQVTGRTQGGVVMALQHESLPLFGVQFHPESVLTEGGHLLLANWLAVLGDTGAPARAAGLSPLVTR
ncbi:aminodeoxychorismate/anthranilate synthase component II [Aquipuribacter sp. MA13-6]|uniref:aminodeoxychorismate/anthranilate synthase component II n=1 Tax=unclassified Aquipuribacter TaxID=2635084 RepID=UPI003EF07AF9